jgi:hypothetical protein
MQREWSCTAPGFTPWYPWYPFGLAAGSPGSVRV